MGEVALIERNEYASFFTTYIDDHAYITVQRPCAYATGTARFTTVRYTTGEFIGVFPSLDAAIRRANRLTRDHAAYLERQA